MSVTETYSITDYIWSNPLTSNTGFIDWQSNTTVSYSSEGTTYKATGDTENLVDITVPLNVECTFEVQFSDGYGGMLCLHNIWNYKNNNEMCLIDIDNASAWNNRTKKTLSLANNTWHTFKQVYEDGVTTLYVNGTSQLTESVTKSTPVLNIRCNNHNVLIRNIKIKPL